MSREIMTDTWVKCNKCRIQTVPQEVLPIDEIYEKYVLLYLDKYEQLSKKID